ncbi:hypothetical protein MSG28_016169 [Choristoneura fumiferana]|uniref:Uncharacterized protein n=1 Tax=Choristoneura fumiferana TaxID=7141 RepID=A0ACC0K5M8_CHOFU|nr:hypothetical protein MSG28_016169 [Choristoneura fumiferana]
MALKLLGWGLRQTPTGACAAPVPHQASPPGATGDLPPTDHSTSAPHHRLPTGRPPDLPDLRLCVSEETSLPMPPSMPPSMPATMPFSLPMPILGLI